MAEGFRSIWLTSREYAIALSISEKLDCDAILAALEADSGSILSLAIDDPRRQLMAALRWRSRCMESPGYAERDRLEGVTFWLALQGGCPLSAGTV